jgi:hypothetical protein
LNEINNNRLRIFLAEHFQALYISIETYRVAEICNPWHIKCWQKTKEVNSPSPRSLYLSVAEIARHDLDAN